MTPEAQKNLSWRTSIFEDKEDGNIVKISEIVSPKYFKEMRLFEGFLTKLGDLNLCDDKINLLVLLFKRLCKKATWMKTGFWYKIYEDICCNLR